ncbi:hypothetical protein EKK97_08115 [Billgrantia tianxiuensis]|jgi:pilus assembly protein Flp/PilA|uniref:Pilus assembly protein Flp/PilA n=1 Tax=Billgrantia tianxiuensis TaxID=2497861 RepID=A0A6I6SP33_9GAMM|nr:MULTISPECIES: hypothetical protein [Halomonas]MCE8032457.1 hypothetical protein [Halomonas sp. MCCC 1A11057]QHC49580.1 hypothetical protein EKK97_08115 [Halomonas tianxiuensis]
MSKLMQGIVRFWREEEGTEVVEWALVGGLIVAVGAAVFVTIGEEAETQLNKIVSLLQGESDG